MKEAAGIPLTPSTQLGLARLSTLVLNRRGPAPLIASSLARRYHSSFAIAIFGCVVISPLATAMRKDNANQNISGD